MSIRIVKAVDVRRPLPDVARAGAGSDAMNPDPDYSAAYVVLRDRRGARGTRPDVHDRPRQRGVRRGDRGARAARRRRAPRSARARTSADSGGGSASDSQLRWLGPEKGVIHLATAAVVNAVWDLYAKAEGKPLWKLLADMTPEQLVGCIDFRYIDDALTPDEALRSARAATRRPRREREAELLRTGYPAYTTSVGWMGYSDETSRGLCREALDEGWTHFKMKVGGRAGRRSAPGRARPRGDRPGRIADDRCEPGVGRRAGDRAGSTDLARGRSVVDRGADEPGRRARALARSATRSAAGRRRDRRTRAEPRGLQAAAAGAARSTSARSTAAGWAA